MSVPVVLLEPNASLAKSATTLWVPLSAVWSVRMASDMIQREFFLLLLLFL